MKNVWIKIKNTINQKKIVLILSGLVLILLMTSLYFYWQVLTLKKDPTKLIQYPHLDFTREFISQEYFRFNPRPLKNDLQELVQSAGFDTISIYVEFLNSGSHIGIAETERIFPASLDKLPIALVVMRKVENQEWDMDDKLVLFEQDKDDGWGDLYRDPVGTKYTIELLLKSLLVDSDNTARNIFLRNITEPELNDLATELGLDELFDESGKISTVEYARLLRSLYTSSFLTRKSSEYVLQLMSNRQNDYLAAGIPQDIQFAHKIGQNNALGVTADAGIIYIPHKPILIAVIIQQSSDAIEQQEKIQTFMKQVGQKVIEYVSE